MEDALAQVLIQTRPTIKRRLSLDERLLPSLHFDPRKDARKINMGAMNDRAQKLNKIKKKPAAPCDSPDQAPAVFNVDGGRVEWFNDHNFGQRRKSCTCSLCGNCPMRKGDYIIFDEEIERRNEVIYAFNKAKLKEEKARIMEKERELWGPDGKPPPEPEKSKINEGFLKNKQVNKLKVTSILDKNNHELVEAIRLTTVKLINENVNLDQNRERLMVT